MQDPDLSTDRTRSKLNLSGRRSIPGRCDCIRNRQSKMRLRQALNIKIRSLSTFTTGLSHH
ncbi:hypothetical protein Mapa_013077 [Marchantia paleacea]|nr:hypothetical protein Mapa_013077 [Marchantia paleacea]